MSHTHIVAMTSKKGNRKANMINIYKINNGVIVLIKMQNGYHKLKDVNKHS